jgi:hypothetical protein
MNRGGVVLVPFPFQDRPGEKVRPAVVVQSDAESRRIANTILAMITGNLADAGQPTAVLVDPATPDPLRRGAGQGGHPDAAGRGGIRGDGGQGRGSLGRQRHCAGGQEAGAIQQVVADLTQHHPAQAS